MWSSREWRGHDFILSSVSGIWGWKPSSKWHETHWETEDCNTRQNTKSAIGQGEGRTETELRKAWSHEEGRGFGPLWEKSGGFHWCHTERNFLIHIHWRTSEENSLLPPATVSSSELWKQAHVVAWCTIKALHIHHCAKKTYPKNSLLVTEHPYWNLSDCPSASNDSSPAHNFTTSKQQCFLSSSIQFISSSQWGAFAIPTHFEPVLWFYLHGNNLLPWEGALIN